MWEIPFYAILMPIITIALSLIGAIKLKNYYLAPLTIFVGLNVLTIVLPLVQNVGWQALFGWAAFYTVVSLIISLIVKLVSAKVAA
ncbi:DUF2651 family protein [Lederbergia wuyishanensis]|uniref:DUF2651 domain-containing protein n=1 Tax=Lederbergia wuyishanensis TaxID=1347903 RepID=A0ABU0D3V1_9BACI|nr:DUF2651 family protein [Lederbergia wuyishanensis]MCJ8007748.1 DUF2651 family protein [Lederbergia wuyishanensis]MDQ0343089.1 hypothetical protein [Lederbergia wuyishanensis]